MTTAADPATSVTTSVTVPVAPERAFDYFTLDMGKWWNPDHHILAGELAAMHLEQRVGGRIWDEATDGGTCTWGRVLVWDRPRTFAFAWLIALDWNVLDFEAPASRVTVSFEARGEQTLVTLVHDRLDAHGPGWEGMRAAVASPGGWSLGLTRYADSLGASAA